jgi:hypothetical protein
MRRGGRCTNDGQRDVRIAFRCESVIGGGGDMRPGCVVRVESSRLTKLGRRTSPIDARNVCM